MNAYPSAACAFRLPEGLFVHDQGEGCHRLLNNLIDALEREKQLFAVLPQNVSPAELACFFAVNLLPHATRPPTPHCKIALLPGRGFVRDLEAVTLRLRPLNDLFTRARMAGTFRQLTPPADRVRKRLRKGIEEDVAFHWIWRCDRVQSEYRRPIRDPIGPRNYYGKGDSYDSTIDLIDAGGDTVWDCDYDLAVFCPFYNAVAFEEWQATTDALAAQIEKFPAARKLIVVRSAFDHWARKLEQKVRAKGVACSIEKSEKDEGCNAEAVRIEIVEQCLNGAESAQLYEALRRAARSGGPGVTKAMQDVHSLLRRTLVGVGPWEEEGRSASDEMWRCFEVLGLNSDTALQGVVKKLIDYVCEERVPEKIEKIIELSRGKEVIVWATRDLDRKGLQDRFQARNLKIEVRLTDRKMKFLEADEGRCRMLSRVDRESHLDWASHMRNGDIILLSAWEAVILRPVVMKYWERSENWRSNGIDAGVAAAARGANEADPILELANTVLGRETGRGESEPGAGEEEESFWWDELYRGHSYETGFEREEALVTSGGVVCVELRFDDSSGIFLREGGDFQVLRESAAGDVELLSLPADEVVAGDLLVLPKDEERGSILDIIMNYLSSSEKYGADARVVTVWKDNLRAAFKSKGETISSLKAKVEAAGGHCDQVTVRTWIFGTTMAPRDEENIVALIKILGIDQPSLQELQESVARLRGIPRIIGRMLSQFVTERDFNSRQKKELEQLIADAGITREMIRSAVVMKRVTQKGDYSVHVNASYVRRPFVASSEIEQ